MLEEGLARDSGMHAGDEPAPDDSCPGSHKDLALALHQRSLPARPPRRVGLQSSTELHILLQYSVIPAGNMLYLGTCQEAWGGGRIEGLLLGIPLYRDSLEEDIP